MVGYVPRSAHTKAATRERSISFTSGSAIRSFASVRTILASGILLLSVAVASAQEQEKKLLDRLLKPDTSFQNPVQTKQFVATGEVMTKKAPTKPFFVPRSWWEKKYPGVKEVQPKEFATEQSRFAGKEANTSSRHKLTKVDEPYRTAAYVTREATGTDKSVETGDYSGVRPFLVKGKSQKALNAQDRPLTIDEVRELLNKNK